jgi:hypothetical protein
MGVYTEALAWANERGDSGGAQRMRKLILSLYNTDFYAYSAGDALAGIDANGRHLAFACLAFYASNGECSELRQVGGQLRQSSWLTGWVEMCRAVYERKQELLTRWRLESMSDSTG